jgi:hypothetical protein
MRYSVEKLLHGQAEIVDYYRKAADRWQWIWSQPEVENLETFARFLREQEPWFENNCGGRWLAQEIMVVSGFAGLYHVPTGFEDNLERAKLLFDAFRISRCSIDARCITEEVAKSYHLFENSLV